MRKKIKNAWLEKPPTKAEPLINALHKLALAHAIVVDKLADARQALKDEKKHRKRGKAIFKLSGSPAGCKPKFYSPSKIDKAFQ